MLKELIPLTVATIGTEEQKTVDARALYEFLGVKSRFNDWIANRIKKYDLSEGVDFVSLTKNLVNGGTQKEVFLSLITAKELAMVENNERGKQARLYFIECERVAKVQTKAFAQLPDFTNPAIAARAWADEVEKNQKLIEQAKADAPKVEFSESVVASDAEMTITATAKVLGIGPRKLFDWLRLNGFLYKQANQATQDAINRGYMVVRFHSIQHADGVEQKAYPHVTGAGLFYFYGRLRKEGLIQKNEELELVA